MKTAIIGLPMVGKTSLFTILTGVTQETRMGSTAVRTGVAKVPDPRVDALAEQMDSMPNLQLVGLMTMAPLEASEAKIRQAFARTRLEQLAVLAAEAHEDETAKAAS